MLRSRHTGLIISICDKINKTTDTLANDTDESSMHQIAGYSIKEQIHGSSNSQVFRAERDSDHQPVILKRLNGEFPSTEKIARFRNEFEILQHLQQNQEGVIRPIELIRHENTLIIAEEDIGGISLGEQFREKRPALELFFELAIRISEIIGDIHHCNVIHKDINPDNIIWNSSTGKIKIIDFDISTQLTTENTAQSNLNHLEGTLDYISPEQTGRMNRVVDYRSDYYSLGASLYFLLVGHPPFQYDDRLELLHAHIARVPTPLYELNASVPNVISSIVLKLLAKNAEDRYQGTFGLISDLKTCQRLYAKSASIKSFEIGQSDTSERFSIPHKLYGRENELNVILNSFEEVCHGNIGLVIVKGSSGIGKTAMIHEIRKPIMQHHGYFVEGKFNQFKRDVPYSSIIHAFQNLIRQILSEPEERVIQWRENILSMLGSNASVIIEVISELGQLLGPQPPMVKLGGVENQNRFKSTFKAFVRALANLDTPLVLFLDDLQWADLASLEFLENILTDTELQGLLVIGAYRDNEVDRSHPLMAVLKNINKERVLLRSIELKPLGESHIITLLHDSLGSDIDELQALSKLCFDKTQGNPFFLTRFLHTLADDKLITFDRTKGCWTWTIEQIQAKGFTDNVLDLMIEKIKQLPADTQRILLLASVLGNQFGLQMLAWINHQSLSKTAQMLWPALQDNLVSPTCDNYRYVEQGSEDDNVIYMFAHDRIQQASYSLLNESEMPTLQLTVGTLMQKHWSKAQQEDRLFEIINHLNQAITIITESERRIDLAELNLTAAKKANSSSAFEAAIHYLDISMNLLPGNSWETHYPLSLAIYTEMAENAVLVTDYEKAEKALTIATREAKSNIDQVLVAEIKIKYLASQSNLSEIVGVGLKALNLLGFKFPRQPNKLQLIFALLKTERLLKKFPPEKLLELPKMDNQEMLMAFHLIQEWSGACYQIAPELSLLSTCKMIQLSTKHGNTAGSAYAYAHFGAILCGLRGEMTLGYQMAELGFKLVDRHQFLSNKTKIKYIFHSIVQVWKDHPNKCIEGSEEGFRSCQESGDMDFSTLCLSSIVSIHLRLGTPLKWIQDKGNDIILQLHKLGFERGLQSALVFSLFAYYFRGETTTPVLWPDEWKKEENLQNHLKKNNRTLLCTYHILKLQQYYMREEYESANQAMVQAKANLQSITGMSYNINFHFYGALNQFSRADKLTRWERYCAIKSAYRSIKQMEKWYSHAPMNFEQKLFLMKAEAARVARKDMSIVIALFDRSIASAQKHQYLNEEALGNELAAIYLNNRGHFTMARTYMQQAHYLYSRWQAAGKVKQIEECYTHLLNSTNQVQGAHPSTTTVSAATRSNFQQGTISIFPNITMHGDTSIFDIDSVLKASQLISGDIVLSSLLKNMMAIVLESAGAQKGFLIFIDNNRLLIEAEGQIGSDNIQVLEGKPIKESTNLSQSIVQYVARSCETLLLNQASEQGDFTEDSYILEQQPKSILCYPLINQGELAGILYLENNLLDNAFTPERVKVLDIIASQIVISIDNAKLYGRLEERNKRINHILAATKAMSKAKTNIQASHIALEHLVILDNKIDLNTAQLIVPQKNDDSYVCFLLWENGKEIPTPTPSVITSELKARIEKINDICIADQSLYLPITSKKARMATLELSKYQVDSAGIEAESLSVLEGLARSLALTMENIESEENSRLSGIGTMAASIVHDLKNPIGSIMGYAEMAEEGSLSTAERNKYLSVIKSEAKRMSAMAHEVLEFSQGKLNLALSVVDSHAFITDIAKTLHPIFASKNIDFKINIDYQGPIEIDDNRIRRVILNLATNAGDAIVDSTEKKSQDKINRTAQYYFELAIKKVTDGVLIIATDNGPGIPEQIRATLFEPFVTHGKAHGIGLGMAIVKKMVEAHLGTIQFETELNKGTRFNLFFPQDFEKLTLSDQDYNKSQEYTNQHNEVKVNDKSSINDKPKLTILIADDNVVNQIMLQRFLSKIGYQTDIVNNGIEAITALKKKHYDLVLMDIEMPEMDGLEATKEIRHLTAAETEQDVIIIAMTGHSGEEAEKDCADAGMNAILSKPISLSMLKEAIVSHIAID